MSIIIKKKKKNNNNNIGMVNIIGCLIALIVGLLIGNIEYIDTKKTKVLTIIGWIITLYLTKLN